MFLFPTLQERIWVVILGLTSSFPSKIQIVFYSTGIFALLKVKVKNMQITSTAKHNSFKELFKRNYKIISIVLAYHWSTNVVSLRYEA